MIEDDFELKIGKKKKRRKSTCRLSSAYFEIEHNKSIESIDLSSIVDLHKKDKSLHIVLMKESNKIEMILENSQAEVIEEWYNLLFKFKAQNKLEREKMNEMRMEICTLLQNLFENKKSKGIEVTRLMSESCERENDLRNSIDQRMIDLRRNSEVTYFETTNHQTRKNNRNGSALLKSNELINLSSSNENVDHKANKKKNGIEKLKDLRMRFKKFIEDKTSSFFKKNWRANKKSSIPTNHCNLFESLPSK